MGVSLFYIGIWGDVFLQGVKTGNPPGVIEEKLETLAEGGEEQNIGRAVATLDGYMAQTKLTMRPM